MNAADKHHAPRDPSLMSGLVGLLVLAFSAEAGHSLFPSSCKRVIPRSVPMLWSPRPPVKSHGVSWAMLGNVRMLNTLSPACSQEGLFSSQDIEKKQISQD